MIRQNFNADWTVEKGDGNSRMNSFLGNTQTKTVHLPYDAMIHEARTPDTKNGAQTGFYPGGEYIFQKHFTAPQAWQGKPVSLVFEGVYQTALVYLNGWLLTRNVNGYAEFTVEAGPYLKYGADNLLKVIADNSLEPNSRWYTGSGIYRPVRLLVGNKVYLPQDTVRITTREADDGFALLDVTAQVQSASTVTERVTLQQTICREGTAVLADRQNLLLQPGESRTVSFRYCVDSPALWSPENPNLYTSTMQVLEGEEELDREETGFGIRTLSIDAAHGVRINGQTVKLRGACIHHDNGILGAATLPDAEERRIRQLKEAGFNAIRSSHHPAGRALLDACDRYGVLVMDELSDVWNVRKNPYDYALYFEQDWKPTIQKMVAKDYNHPSVILYCVGNEISEAGSESGAETNRRLCNTFRDLGETPGTPNTTLTVQAKRLLGRYELPTIQRLTALCSARHPEQAGAFAALRAEAEQLTAENACCRVSQLAVNGRDLMAAGVRPGPGLRQVLNALLETVITGQTPNEKDALLAAAAQFSAS